MMVGELLLQADALTTCRGLFYCGRWWALL